MKSIGLIFLLGTVGCSEKNPSVTAPYTASTSDSTRDDLQKSESKKSESEKSEQAPIVGTWVQKCFNKVFVKNLLPAMQDVYSFGADGSYSITRNQFYQDKDCKNLEQNANSGSIQSGFYRFSQANGDEVGKIDLYRSKADFDARINYSLGSFQLNENRLLLSFSIFLGKYECTGPIQDESRLKLANGDDGLMPDQATGSEDMDPNCRSNGLNQESSSYTRKL